MGRLGCCAAKLALVSLLVMNVRCNETTHNDDAGVVSLGPADLPSQVQEAFKVAGIFDKMVSQSNTPTREQQQLPEEDLVSLTMSPLEAAEKEAVGDLDAEPLLGAPAPDENKKQTKKRLVLEEPEHRKLSQGTVLNAHGNMMLTDFVTVEKPKESMKIYEQRAADDAADLSGPVESLVQISEGAAAEWGGRRRRGSPDPGEEQKREGWQLRYPGIEEKVEMANYVADGPVEQTMMLPGTKQEQKKETNVEKAEGQEFEVKDAPQFVGCFSDGDKARVLPIGKGAGRGGGAGIGLRGVMGGNKPSNMEPMKCALLCSDYQLMGLQTVEGTTFCYCGQKTGLAERVDVKDCNEPCAGNPGTNCGAPLRVSVYSLKVGDTKCWDGSIKVDGHDTEKPWHQYRKCASCGQVPEPGEQWQQWGKKMEMAMFAACMSCEADAAFVMVDPAKRIGFCRDFNPIVDTPVTYTYPHFAHWDGKPDFVHTKFVQKYTVPKVRKGKAAAVCNLWKQTRCEVSAEAKMQSWKNSIGKSRGMSAPKPAVQRTLQCSISKVVKCSKVCVAKKKNLGRNPKQKHADCGAGGVEVNAADEGLKAQLGKAEKGLNGIWCCFNGCQVPPEHSTYKEDGSFWCKDELLSW